MLRRRGVHHFKKHRGRISTFNKPTRAVGCRAGSGIGDRRWKRTDFHALNQATLKGKPVAHALIGQNRSSQVTHDLMHLDPNAPRLVWVKGNWLDTRIDLAPLLRPVSANFFRPTDKTAFERSRPSRVRGHQANGGVNVTRVKGRVCRTKQLYFSGM